VNYFAELGFFFVAGLVFLWNIWRKRDFGPALQATVLLAGISVFIASFFRSGVISMNDLGARGFLPAQFVLLLWAAELFSHAGPRPHGTHKLSRAALWKWTWAFFLTLGVAGTLYQVSMLRVHGMLADGGMIPPWFAPDRQLGERTYALREAYDRAKTRLESDALIQNDPKWKYDDIYFGLYSDRQTAAYDSSCGAQFGGDPAACVRDFPSLAELFADPDAYDLKGVTDLCNGLRIRALVIKDKDGIWTKQPPWLQNFPVIAANAHVRIIEIPAVSRAQASSAVAIHRSTRPGTMPTVSR
jgi:hypothetical protein